MTPTISRLLHRSLLALSALGLAHASTYAATNAPDSGEENVCEKPEYPKASLRRNEQGAVVLNFLIGADGLVHDSAIATSSGFPLLDNAARVSLSKCKFKPALQDGKPTQQWVKVQYVWTIEGPDPIPEEKWLELRAAAGRGDPAGEFGLALLYINAEDGRKNLPEAQRLLTSAASKNYAEAQYALATMQQSGEVGRTPLSETAALYRRAAEQGHKGAQHMLGLMLSFGKGVTQDPVEAMAWFRKASAQGHAGAGGRLGAMLVAPGNDAKNVAEGFQLLSRSADAADPYAQFALGQCYEFGRGVVPDKVRALALYEVSAQSGNMQAKYAWRELSSQSKP